MAGVRKPGTKIYSSVRGGVAIPKPRAKAKGLALFGGASNLRSAKKTALQEDPMKFGNFGFDLNMQGPAITEWGRRK
jgi:hypothetical protein